MPAMLMKQALFLLVSVCLSVQKRKNCWSEINVIVRGICIIVNARSDWIRMTFDLHF